MNNQLTVNEVEAQQATHYEGVEFHGAEEFDQDDLDMLFPMEDEAGIVREQIAEWEHTKNRKGA